MHIKGQGLGAPKGNAGCSCSQTLPASYHGGILAAPAFVMICRMQAHLMHHSRMTLIVPKLAERAQLRQTGTQAPMVSATFDGAGNRAGPVERFSTLTRGTLRQCCSLHFLLWEVRVNCLSTSLGPSA